MDFRFTPEQEAFRQEVRAFIRAELPHRIYAGEHPYNDANFEDTMAFRRKLGKKKWIGIGWEPEYGGLGAGMIEQMVFHEEMIYHLAPLDSQAYQVGPAIIGHGSEYLKRKFLAATANQEIVWAQGFSEPNAGSDLANLQTRAEEDGDDFLITGQKIWTSYAHRASNIHILTRTDPTAPKHKGISYFVLDMKTPGITVSPLIDMTGSHHFNQVFFDKVRVPRANMIGEKNKGWYVAMTTLEGERSGIRDVARARRLLDDVFTARAEMDAKASVRHDIVMRSKLADLAVQVETGRMLSYRVGWMQATRRQVGAEPSIAKLFASEACQRITRVGMEMLGLYGQPLMHDRHAPIHGHVPDTYMREIPHTIAAGTSEVNRNVIASRGLGLPR